MHIHLRTMTLLLGRDQAYLEKRLAADFYKVPRATAASAVGFLAFVKLTLLPFIANRNSICLSSGLKSKF